MGFEKVISRASVHRGQYDHVAWEGICRRCGLERKMFADEVEKEFGNARCDLRNKEIKCRSPRCNGTIHLYGKMPAKRAVHLNDIRRRK